ncbi:class I SAM-dependent methyltransferase [Formosa sp. S-31]|uniref:class I SAM-dependent methyltransferase n=1 Tax=Formosa sp. S-31 TaxID=2790949 RepID=UPI003EB8C5C3
MNNFSKTFESHTLKYWSNRKNINKAEQYIFSKYLKNKNNSILDAGTGSGILAFYFEQALGFKNIVAFDIIPKMIDIAKEKASIIKSNINFQVADASSLQTLKDESFDYLCYLQQIICMVPQSKLNDALKEAHRLGKKDSLYFFSFLNWNSRWYNPFLSFALNSTRFLKGNPFQKYYLPEVKLKGKLNLDFFKSDQHPILWIKKNDIEKLLHKNGFSIESIFTEYELTNKKGSNIYVICSKS